MCRMIAAAGTLEPARLRGALEEMAANRGSAHDHERRGRGARWRHEDGWGAAWMDNGSVRTCRSHLSILSDPDAAHVDDIRSHLLILHARRASHPRKSRLENSHPFRARHNGKVWAFCHNGTLLGRPVLRAAPGLTPEGGTDSERLFHHLLAFLDESDPEASIQKALERIPDYTSLHSFLIGPEWTLAIARRHERRGLPRYHALWLGVAPNLRVVASEPVGGLGVEPEGWSRVEEPGFVRLCA